MIYTSVEELIGNTPLLKLPKEVHGLEYIDVYAKLEYYNPFGSVKDRIAKGMLNPIIKDLKSEQKTILEASSGNTAKALCALGGIHGLEFKTVTNRIKSPEIRMLLQVMGASIEELPGLSDCPDPMDPNDFTTVAENMAKEQPDVYHYTDQYFNKLNLSSHKSTGKEIDEDLDGKVDYYFGFLGTCGSSMGVGTYLKEQGRQTDIYGVVAEAGYHVPGGRNINELWEVGFFKKDFFTDIISGTSVEAIDGLLDLVRRCGVMAGPTSGLTYYTMIKKLQEIDKTLDGSERKNAVFIACDRLEPYTSYVKKYRPDIFSTNTTERKTVHNVSEDELSKVESVTTEELSLVLQNKSTTDIVIDVRGHFAFNVGHIPASINILDELFAMMINEGRMFPEKTNIYVVCARGTVSKKYAAFLQTQGYTAKHLEGGVMKWRSDGFDLERA